MTGHGGPGEREGGVEGEGQEGRDGREGAAPRSALVLVGRGRYADPWHDDAATGHRVAGLLAARGLDVTVRGTAPDVLGPDDAAGEGGAAAAAGATGAPGTGAPSRPALLVVAAGTGRTDPAWDGDDAAWAAFHARLAALVGAGVPLLALHQAANTFTDAPGWADLVGGRWVPGLSMHPPIGEATFRPVPGERHPVVAGLGPVRAFDERYCLLQPDPRSRVLLTTEHEGADHPVVWQAPGPGRVLYDALGHDLRSYASEDRRALLAREVAWLLDGAPGGADPAE
ncbi:ThuA domain-containing protein [Cellulomonas endophytica]|uniref:ThuA domain-containing protein n=1 Tax=Cellulomonas endophytica TaxID=2494735 RepID=UPI0010132015|nr:ThuA domain-containing protein [Cellulomonas endophytica]